MELRDMQGSKADGTQESEELVQFRQRWLEEVRGKKKAQPSPGQDSAIFPSVTSASSLTQSSDSPPVHAHRSAHRRRSPSIEVVSPPLPARKPASATSDETQFSPVLQRAVEVYRKAIQHEQRSELDDALRLYRTAFRMDSNVDRAYHLVEEELHRKAATANTASSVAPVATVPHKAHHQKAPTGTVAVDGLLSELQGLELGPSRVPIAHARRDGFVTGTLAKLVSAWPVNLTFEAEDTSEGVPIQSLPDELLVLVLRLLDHTAIERFGRVNRKARFITLDPSIWRPVVKTIYQPPQISEDEELESLVGKYLTDYRRVYIEHPRVRYDGVYIAVCHYIRNGIGENVWVNYTHLITYYRYLRIYPDGQVLSLLANEELAPSQVIPLLKPTLRMKGFFMGTWYLDGTELHIEDLLPMEPSAADTRYSFQMILELRSRPVGRWNRLDFRAYNSVHLGSGEATPLGLKNERSFWFSRVRSYV